MKFLALLALVVCLFLDEAQSYPRQKCRAEPGKPDCVGGLNEGKYGIGCVIEDFWGYNQTLGECVKFNYYGCGGNSNRHCSQGDCQKVCPS